MHISSFVVLGAAGLAIAAPAPAPAAEAAPVDYGSKSIKLHPYC